VIEGGSADPLYSGWIEVISFAAGTEKEVTFNANGTVSTGPAGFKSFTLVKKVDASTAPLFGKLSTGGLLSTVKMVVVDPGPNCMELWNITATTCFLQEQGIGASAGDSDVEERIKFVAAAFEWSYIQLQPSGDPLLEYFASYDLITQAIAVGARAPLFLGGADSDGDGIPDGWKLFYGLQRNLADSALDSDGDGLDNLHEYIAHTHPRQPQSTFRVTALQKGTEPTFLLTWRSAAGLTYRVETAPAPSGPWTFVRSVPSAGTGTTTTTVNSASPQTFFRVLVP
jgi:type VI protein secretion system component Hcp